MVLGNLESYSCFFFLPFFDWESYSCYYMYPTKEDLFCVRLRQIIHEDGTGSGVCGAT